VSDRPVILVSNDDGALSPGIANLVEVAEEFGDVVVCAPSNDQSGVSHSISLHRALRISQVAGRPDHWFQVDGSPVDCVYVGALHLCPRQPDIVLSGINHGYNLGTDVVYSGTVGAAREGVFRGASGLAVSTDREAETRAAQPHVRRVLELLVARHDAGVVELMNLNIPPGAGEGTRMVTCHLGRRAYRDSVVERHDLQGRPYYWIGGPPEKQEGPEGCDLWANAQGWVTLSSISMDPSGTLGSRSDWAKALGI
jgi:5'-nucleotidase